MARSTVPGVSVVLTGNLEPADVRPCLDAFARQTVSGRRFEVLCVGAVKPLGALVRTVPTDLVLEPFNGTAAAAKNRALKMARAPVVLFWSARWRPLPETVEYVGDFHRHHTRDDHVVRLHAVPHISLRTNPFAMWRIGKSALVDEPAASGVFSWPHFRMPGLAAKRQLFDLGQFDPTFEALEDLELGARLAGRSALTVWFERLPLASIADRVSFAGGWTDAYASARWRRRRLLADPRAQTIEDVDDTFVRADQFARSDADLVTMRATIAQLEVTLEGLDLPVLGPTDAARLRLLYDLYDGAIQAAKGRGWLDAV